MTGCLPAIYVDGQTLNCLLEQFARKILSKQDITAMIHTWRLAGDMLKYCENITGFYVILRRVDTPQALLWYLRYVVNVYVAIEMCHVNA